MTAREWFALLAGHLAWSAHLVVSYHLASRACAWPGGDTLALLALRHGTTVAAAAVTVAALVASWPGWRAAWSRASTPRAEPASATPAVEPVRALRRFVHDMALPLNAAYLFGVLAAGAANFVLPACA
jgi:hypothetical protein